MSEAGRYGPLVERLCGEVVCVMAPAGWRVADVDFPELGVGRVGAGQEDGVDLVCAAGVVSEPGFVDTCVVTAVGLPGDVADEAWLTESTVEIARAMPGARLIDVIGWESPSGVEGLLRLGVYVSEDDRALTFLQATWVSPGRLGVVRRGVTATFTCPTRTSPDTVPFFLEMADTLEVM